MFITVELLTASAPHSLCFLQFYCKSNCFCGAQKISTINKKKEEEEVEEEEEAPNSSCGPSHTDRGFHRVDDDTHVQRPHKSVGKTCTIL